MNTTIFLFHPSLSTSRVNARLAERAAEIPSVTVRDEYALNPQRIDVAAEQAAMTAADRIVLQFPMYWYSSPSLLKQWEDDVLTWGWAYGSAGTALHGKELAIAISTGADDYRRDGVVGYTVTDLLRPFQATSNLIGTRFLAPFVTSGAMSISDDALTRQADAYATFLTTDNLPVLGDHE